MKSFLADDFLLDNPTALRLFNERARGLPIFDYHCHLSPQAIAEDKPFSDLAELWLGGDHYKWRLMRANGADERLCSGTAPLEEKFAAWARALQSAAGNPLLEWSHLELRRYYGIDDVLTPANAAAIHARANAIIRERQDRPSTYMDRFKVAVACTTDDPADDLRWHKAIAADTARKTRVLPTFRPDRVAASADPVAWKAYMEKLGAAANVHIGRWSDLARALDIRHAFFHSVGCRVSDHALTNAVYANASERELDDIMASLLAGKSIAMGSRDKLTTALLREAARLDVLRGWTMQLHISALRNINGRLFASYGPDGGGDGISDEPVIEPLARFLASLLEQNQLPRVVLYSLDPAKNEALAALAGCLQGDGKARVQHGAAWWFNDQLDGMRRQITTQASLGLLGEWVGMLTDSRSFLSYPRHEYFRRLLSNLVGTWVEEGRVPDDDHFTGDLVANVCWGNAATWFGIEPPAWSRS